MRSDYKSDRTGHHSSKPEGLADHRPGCSDSETPVHMAACIQALKGRQTCTKCSARWSKAIVTRPNIEGWRSSTRSASSMHKGLRGDFSESLNRELRKSVSVSDDSFS